MKKLIFILSIFAFIGSAVAQGTATLKTRRQGISGFAESGTYVATATKTVDSCVGGADTVYFFFNAANMKNGSFIFRSTLISGTSVVTGYLECSNDGITWATRPTGHQITGDTINLKPAANATKTGAFAITQNNYQYYRFRFIGHNTGGARLTGIVLSRRD